MADIRWDMRGFITHPATGTVLVLALAGAGYLGFVNNVYVGILLWAAAAVIVAVYAVSALRNRRVEVPTEGSGGVRKKSKKIKVRDINAPTTFGKNSPITVGQQPLTLKGSDLDSLAERLKKYPTKVSLVASFAGGAFHGELVDLLSRAGWSFHEVVIGDSGLGTGPRIEMRLIGSPPPGLDELERILSNAGYTVERTKEGGEYPTIVVRG